MRREEACRSEEAAGAGEKRKGNGRERPRAGLGRQRQGGRVGEGGRRTPRRHPDRAGCPPRAGARRRRRRADGNRDRGARVVMASKASATATMRASIGICSPRRPSGKPRPSSRSWWERTIRSTSGDSCASGQQHPLAQRRVLLDLAELLGGERAGLVQHRLAGADLPDVVQLAAEPDCRPGSARRSPAARRSRPRTGSPGWSGRWCRRPWPRARGPASGRLAGTAPGSAGACSRTWRSRFFW